ncbi:AraC family transcriptional regulator [Kordiimonas lacus]|uniref:AraC family transcriptional regulator n=1 Tax=Kordiimonas lacus TaxID=637679 RepID=A0A1G7A026_9PROT|nr:AraC family transcriptional regulator [Kordiimonas lacus]SDE07847.1 AraC family transcriptional regulator [Kordiimonas lacus]
MSYQTQINRAVDYIEDNLFASLTVAAIAREAGLSKWYFQRLFRAMVGDTVKEYIQHRRLSHAASQLLTTDRKVIDIALACDFASPEVFTRAFRRAFGTNPQAFRTTHRADRLIPRKPRITTAYLAHLYEGMTMEPTIKHMPALTAAGFAGLVVPLLNPDTDNMKVIPGLWQALGRHISALPTGPGTRRISVILGPDEAKADGKIEYLAGITVAGDGAPLPEGASLRQVPAGDYAVFTHIGPVETLAHTKNYIYGSWLPKSGRVRTDGPQYTLYSNDRDPRAEGAEMYIHIPLEPA